MSVAVHAPMRFGILGAARIAPKALIEPAKYLGCARIVAISARDRFRAQAFATAYGIRRVLSSYEELIADPEIDAVYIPLPNSLHCAWTLRALHAGKHVLCEKPMASNAAEAQQMANLADEKGLVLAEAFHYRYHPLASRVRELLQSGCIGRIVHLDGHFSVPSNATDIRLDWTLSGGATMDLGCYLLHMARYFSGLTPVVRRAEALVGPPNIDLSMEAQLDFDRGTDAHLVCSIAPEARTGAWFHAIGDGGEVMVTNPVAPHRGHLLNVRNSSGEQRLIIEGDTTYTHQLQAFVAAIRNGCRIATAGADGVTNMQLIDDIYRAAGLPCRGSLVITPPVGSLEEAALT